ncbi:hypothetical protein QCA50_015354 [Cerrena zonata]|uniref:Uncharacterized protein n=1 Tax=Cerrena zonata TaxID=2478898 RepID=A0AAW0FLV7_9APHY
MTIAEEQRQVAQFPAFSIGDPNTALSIHEIAKDLLTKRLYRPFSYTINTTTLTFDDCYDHVMLPISPDEHKITFGKLVINVSNNQFEPEVHVFKEGPLVKLFDWISQNSSLESFRLCVLNLGTRSSPFPPPPAWAIVPSINELTKFARKKCHIILDCRPWEDKWSNRLCKDKTLTLSVNNLHRREFANMALGIQVKECLQGIYFPFYLDYSSSPLVSEGDEGRALWNLYNYITTLGQVRPGAFAGLKEFRLVAPKGIPRGITNSAKAQVKKLFIGIDVKLCTEESVYKGSGQVDPCLTPEDDRYYGYSSSESDSDV